MRLAAAHVVTLGISLLSAVCAIPLSESHPLVNDPRAKQLVRIFLNQGHYHELEPHEIIWGNTYDHDEAGMGMISFLLMDDIEGTACHEYCIGSLKIPATPASTIHGVLAHESEDWAKLDAELLRAEDNHRTSAGGGWEIYVDHFQYLTNDLRRS
ncbi:hypothetical protein EV368DRAFT_62073 [Lentinula lateritia]|nr:hypothetical protein EV368DRAFT_62073 [Lentinula lateritia]